MCRLFNSIWQQVPVLRDMNKGEVLHLCEDPFQALLEDEFCLTAPILYH